VPSLQALAIFVAGLAAGTINAVVGSGTLITFPVLLAFGYPPVLANVSNTVGLVPGVASGVHGYRAELGGQGRRIIRLGSAAVCGGLVGAILLLVLPAGAFKAIVPALIGVALVMVLIQPRLAEWVARRQQAKSAARSFDADPPLVPQSPDAGTTAVRVLPAARVSGRADAAGGPVLWFLVLCAGVYGGYFGAAQGVLLIGMLGIAFNDGLQRINAAKNVLAGLINGVAAILFIALTHVDWAVAGLIAAGSIIGGQLGARIGRRLPPWGLRLLIVCVGVAALVKLLA
jgi:uncharacterized protein